MRTATIALLTAAFTLVVAAPTAHAELVTIDFRGFPWDLYDGPSSSDFVEEVVDGIAVGLYASPYNLYRDSVDGFGILGGEPDEIDAVGEPETLWVRFDRMVTVESFLVTNLFIETGQGSGGETGYYSSDFVNWTSFVQWSPHPNGELLVDGLDLATTDLYFSALPPGYSLLVSEAHEFSVARIDVSVSAIPEPTTLALFGIGLAGLVAWRRKRRKA